MAHVLVVGAGAAGLFAAGRLVEKGHRVTVVEHNAQPGRKLLITGKGRCNVTNACAPAAFMQNVRRNPKFLYSALAALPPAAVVELFSDKLGLPLKEERGRRIFPQSDKAQDVLDALLRYAKGAQIIKGEAQALLVQNGRAAGLMLADGRQIAADAVLVASGGLSYPALGASGIGYQLAKQAGHSIVLPVPSLVSMVEKGGLCRRMMGLSLKNVALTLLENGKPIYREQGEMLFTHFGLSGPMVLSASAYLGDMQKNRYTISIDVKPALDEAKLDERIRRDFAALQNKDAAHCLDKLLPASMRPVMLELWGVPPQRKVNQVTKEERRRLGQLIKGLEIAVAARGDLDHAVITAGGVDVAQVDPKTMQSRLLPGLYFAGEVLDVDAYTGGYNLHIAWCTAFAAANAVG